METPSTIALVLLSLLTPILPSLHLFLMLILHTLAPTASSTRTLVQSPPSTRALVIPWLITLTHPSLHSSLTPAPYISTHSQQSSHLGSVYSFHKSPGPPSLITHKLPSLHPFSMLILHTSALTASSPRTLVESSPSTRALVLPWFFTPFFPSLRPSITPTPYISTHSKEFTHRG